jgi:hypothetical protein
MSTKQSLIDTIIDFITQRKVARLEKAFKNSPTVISAIKNMHTAYEKMERDLDDYCKKYPSACADAKEKRKQQGLDF